MFAEYIQAALEKAQYKVIDNGDEPYFVDVPELDGVWATGCTVEEHAGISSRLLRIGSQHICCGIWHFLQLAVKP